MVFLILLFIRSQLSSVWLAATSDVVESYKTKIQSASLLQLVIESRSIYCSKANELVFREKIIARHMPIPPGVCRSAETVTGNIYLKFSLTSALNQRNFPLPQKEDNGHDEEELFLYPLIKIPPIVGVSNLRISRGLSHKVGVTYNWVNMSG
jgi:hypothetical protein